jgi:hypothetical protein
MASHGDFPPLCNHYFLYHIYHAAAAAAAAAATTAATTAYVDSVIKECWTERGSLLFRDISTVFIHHSTKTKTTLLLLLWRLLLPGAVQFPSALLAIVDKMVQRYYSLCD